MAIEEEIIGIAATENPRLRARRIEIVAKALADDKRRIAAQMENGGWRSIGFGTLMAVGSATATVADFFGAGAVTHLAKASDTFGLIGAVHHAFVNPSNDVLKDPMAYAALSESELRCRRIGAQAQLAGAPLLPGPKPRAGAAPNSTARCRW